MAAGVKEEEKESYRMIKMTRDGTKTERPLLNSDVLALQEQCVTIFNERTYTVEDELLFFQSKKTE